MSKLDMGEVEALRKTLVATEESRQYWFYVASEENKVADALRAEIARLREAPIQLNKAIDAFWNDHLQTSFRLAERHYSAITAAQVKCRAALGKTDK